MGLQQIAALPPMLPSLQTPRMSAKPLGCLQTPGMSEAASLPGFSRPHPSLSQPQQGRGTSLNHELTQRPKPHPTDLEDPVKPRRTFRRSPEGRVMGCASPLRFTSHSTFPTQTPGRTGPGALWDVSPLSPLKRCPIYNLPNTLATTWTAGLSPSLALLIVPKSLVLLLLFLHSPLPALLDGIQHRLLRTGVQAAAGREGQG